MKTAIIVAVVGLLLATSLTWAKGYGPENRGERIVEKVSKRLELNEFQKEKLEDFAQAMSEMRKSRKGERGQHRQELLGLLDTSTLDRARAMELLDEKHREFKRNMEGMVNAFADFSDSLDAGQREELKEVFAKRMERRHERQRWAH